MGEKRLSLCMIVRDEASMLPGFLRSVEGLWDELIVVDTGSTDDTVTLLEEAGAQVRFRAWDDDFSAARNASLEGATGEWIAFFDADEVLSEALCKQIRELVDAESSMLGAATVVMENSLPGGHMHVAPLLRLFRNDPSIRFVHRIHEDITGAVSAYLARTKQGMTHLSGVVEHLGYVREVAAEKNKRERDVTLLERSLSENPEDLYSHYKLMEQARYWRDTLLWSTSAKRAADVFARVPKERLAALHFGGELSVLLALGLHPKDPARALQWLKGVESRITPSAAFYYWRGYQCELLSQFAEALEDYQRALGLPGTRNIQLATVRPLMGLCRVALATGQLKEASEFIVEALSYNVLDEEIALAARALADVSLDDGDAEIVVALMRPIAGDPPCGADGVTLARALMLGGDIQAARSVVEGMMHALPEAGIGLLMCDLCLGQDSNLSLDLSQEDADQAMKAWISVVLRSKNIEISRGFLQNAGAIMGVFPWIQAYVFNFLGLDPPG